MQIRSIRKQYYRNHFIAFTRASAVDKSNKAGDVYGKMLVLTFEDNEDGEQKSGKKQEQEKIEEKRQISREEKEKLQEKLSEAGKEQFGDNWKGVIITDKDDKNASASKIDKDNAAVMGLNMDLKA